MNNNLDFLYVTSGLEVSFRVISKVPAKSIFDWDFGDDKGEVFNVQPVTTMYFATLVKYYKSLEIELINEKRDFDNLEQSVNRDIYLVPLSYTSVEDGVKKIFDERKGKDISY